MNWAKSRPTSLVSDLCKYISQLSRYGFATDRPPSNTACRAGNRQAVHLGFQKRGDQVACRRLLSSRLKAGASTQLQGVFQASQNRDASTVSCLAMCPLENTASMGREEEKKKAGKVGRVVHKTKTIPLASWRAASWGGCQASFTEAGPVSSM